MALQLNPFCVICLAFQRTLVLTRFQACLAESASAGDMECQLRSSEQGYGNGNVEGAGGHSISDALQGGGGDLTGGGGGQM